MLWILLTTLCAAALMLLLMPRLLPVLKKLKFGQTIYELGPRHQQKQGTPNMGGLLIGGISTVVLIVASAVFGVVYKSAAGAFFSLNNRLFALLFITLGSMAIGFTDDYIKDVRKRHDGLSPKQKIVMQLFVGAVFSVYCYFYVGSDILLPFTEKTWDLGAFYIPLMTLVVMFMTNSANLQDGLDGLRYNKVIVATDADVDGMHIRLLMITFFLQFFPDLIKKGHVYILQTPLFRVRNRKKRIKGSKSEKGGKDDYETIYCYSDEERVAAIEKLSPDPEITRFKGLGEISPDEFKHFIGKDMRLEPVTLRKTDAVNELLGFYMGKNTMERQNFIINNLVIEEDAANDEEEVMV